MKFIRKEKRRIGSRDIRKNYYYVCLMLSFLFLFVGCVKKEKEKKIPIRFLYWASLAENKSYQEICSSFEKMYPDIKIYADQFAGTRYHEKALIQIAAGTPPDIVMIQDLKFGYFAEKKAFEDLSFYIKKTPSFKVEDFYPQAIGAFTIDGHIYAIPKDINPIVLFYNKDMFDKDGVPYPDENWTWDDLIKYGKKLTKFDQSGRPVQIGLTYGFWFIFVLQNKGKIFNEDGTKCLLDSREAIEAIQFIKDLSLKHRIITNSAQLVSEPPFEARKAAMTMAGRWNVPSYRAANLNFDVAPLPMGKVRATSLHFSGFAISSGSRHKEEAWKFLSFLTGIEGQKIMVQTGLLCPTRKSVAESQFFLSSTPPFHNSVFIEEIKFGVPLFLNPFLTRHPEKDLESGEIGVAIDMIVYGDEEVEYYLPKIVDKINKEIERKQR